MRPSDDLNERTNNGARFRWIASATLFAAGVLLYGYTVSFPFVFDDHVYLVGNPLVKEGSSFAFLRDLRAFVAKPREMGLDPDLGTNFILRPFAYLTFHLNFVFDGLRPRGYRAVNILIHCLNAILLFQLLWRLLGHRDGRNPLGPVSVRFIALGSAFLFLVHPLQTESVTYIVQRFTSLGTFFYLLTLLTHLRANAAASRRAACWWRAGSVAALLLGMLTKEEVLTAPLLLVVTDWLLMGTAPKLAVKRALPHLLCLPLIPALVVLASHAQAAGDWTAADAVNVVNPHGYSPYHYALTQLSVVLLYLRLILLPVGLNLDWEYRLSTSLLEGRVLVSAALILGLIAGSWLWRRLRPADARCSLMFVAVIWYFTTLAVSSGVVPLPDLVSEHRCYLASVGAIVALVGCADLLRSRLAGARVGRMVVPAVTAVWVLALGAATVARNNLWRSEISLWKDAAAKSSHKSRIWNNLGVAYYEQGRPQEAIACFRKVIELEPGSVLGYQNLGAALNGIGRPQEALIISQLGLRCGPSYAPLYYNLGVSYYGLKLTTNSIESFTRAVTICPAHTLSHIWLGAIYSEVRQYEMALKHYRAALSLEPRHPKIQEIIRQIEPLARRPGAILTLNLPGTIESVRIP